eukprot:jgi/Psemu1/42977/gm1.42977_g
MEFHVVDKQQAAFLVPKTAAAAAEVAPATIVAAAAIPDMLEEVDLPSSPGLNTLGMDISMLGVSELMDCSLLLSLDPGKNAPNMSQSAKKDREKIDPIALAVEVYPSTPIKLNRSSSTSPTRDPPTRPLEANCCQTNNDSTPVRHGPPENSPAFRSPKPLGYICISTVTKSLSSF